MQDIIKKVLVEKAIWVLLVLLPIFIFIGTQIPKFKLDASADSLLLDDDADLRYFLKSRETYGSDDFLVIAFQPEQDLFAPETLAVMTAFTTELAEIDQVTEVNSILNVPLLQNKNLGLAMLSGGIPTLSDENVDLEKARTELLESPIYSELLIGPEGKTTAIQVALAVDETLRALSRERNQLRAKKYEDVLSEEEALRLEEVDLEYRARTVVARKVEDQTVARVRDVMAAYEDHGTLYLGGVPMIVSDMIQMVDHDIKVFGLGVLAFLIIALAILFRRLRWVILPMITCVAAGFVMFGVLGFFDWRVTVVSSNFSALLFIITMSMTIHMVVRYRELAAYEPEDSAENRIAKAVRLVVVPCFYCALTTMVGFGSLLVSGIKPVIHFGLMMVVGIGFAFLICFTLFPALLSLLPADHFGVREGKSRATTWLGNIAEKQGALVLLTALVLAVIAGFGIARLSVENRFIDYFKPSTEIHRGMVVIDEKLGGTTPLEIILQGEGKDYWFKTDNLATLRKVHEYLESKDAVGKVLSLDSMVKVIEEVTNTKANNFVLSMVRSAVPDKYKKEILQPYVNEDFSETRIVARIQETASGFERQALLEDIRGFMKTETGIAEENVHITGMYILYNNMLQSLFHSQIVTMGMVFFAILLMFTLLFRDLKLALIAIIPNVFPVVLVLGLMGFLGISLDIMTITIAAITIGIAVDHTIHYVHRFKSEFPKLGSYRETMWCCHAGTGKAMYYTSLTIIIGFSILAFSNFIPSIYFGLFTSFAMVVALFSSMTLLPRLLMTLKPFGPEPQEQPASTQG